MSPSDRHAVADQSKVKRQRLILDSGGGAENSSFNKSLSLSSSICSRSFSQSANGSILRPADITNSSFYPGKTVYGGVSSRRSFTLPAASPYKRVDFQRKKTPSRNDKPKSAVPSKAAKIILKSLNQTGFNSPADAKQNRAGLFSPAVYLRRKAAAVGSPGKSDWSEAPPVASLQQTSSAKVIPTVFKPPVPVVSRESSSSVEVKSFAALSGGKLKRDRGQGHYSSKSVAEDEPVEIPQLSTNFVLPINTSAQFNFGLAKSATPSGSKSAKSVADVTAEANAYSFRQPDSLSPMDKPALSPSTPARFSFSSPAAADDKSSQLFNSTPKFFKGFEQPKGKAHNPEAPTFVPKPITNWADLSVNTGKSTCDPSPVSNSEEDITRSSNKPNKSKPDASAASADGVSTTKPPVKNSWGDVFGNQFGK